MGILAEARGPINTAGSALGNEGVGRALVTGDVKVSAMGMTLVDRQGKGITENLQDKFPRHSAQIDRINDKILADSGSLDIIGSHARNRFDMLDNNLTRLSNMDFDDAQIGRVLDSMERNPRAWARGMGTPDFIDRVQRIAGEPAPARVASRPKPAAQENNAAETATAGAGAAAAASNAEAGVNDETAETEAESEDPGFSDVDTSNDVPDSDPGQDGGFAGLFGGNFDLSQIFGGFDLGNMGGGMFESLQNILPGIGSLLTGVFSDMTHHSGTALANLEADGDVSMITRFETVLNSGVYAIGKANRVGNGSMYESSDIPVNFGERITSTVDAETSVERVGPPPAPSQGTEPTQPQSGQQAPAAMAQNMPGQQGPQTPRPGGPDDTAFA